MRESEPAGVRTTRAATSFDLLDVADLWVHAANEQGLAIRVLEAETGLGKTYVAQHLYDVLAANSNVRYEGRAYWRGGLAPTWPPHDFSAVESNRKRVIPDDSLRDPGNGNRLGFAWLGLPVGDVGGGYGPAGQILEQLTKMYDACIEMHSSQVKLRNLIRGAWQGTRTVVGLIPGLAEVAHLTNLFSSMSMAGAASDIVDAWHLALTDPKGKARKEARKAVVAMAGAIRKLGLESDQPLVIVLDDAHAVDTVVLDLIGLLTGVTLPDDAAFDKGGETADGSGSTTLQISRARPDHGLNVLVVATTWPGESALRSGGLFDRWIEVAQSLKGVSTETIRIEPTPVDVARGMLAGAGVPVHFIQPILDHFSIHGSGDAVNPLVLALGRARIDANLKASGLGQQLTLDVIDQLPNFPEIHVVERLEALREVPDLGQLAWEFLVQFALWGIAVPLSVGVELAKDNGVQDRLSEALELLSDRRFVERPDLNSAYPMLRIQVDPLAYLVSKHLQDHAIRKVAEKVRRHLAEDLLRELPGAYVLPTWSDAKLIFQTAQRLDPLPNERLARGIVDEADALAWRYLHDEVPLSAQQRQLVLRVLALSGSSRAALRASVDLAVALRATDSQTSVSLLEPHAAADVYAAVTLATILRSSDPERAIAVLEPHAAADVYAAVTLATILRSTDPERAIAVLETHAATHAAAADRLATMVCGSDPERAIALLEPHVDDARAAVTLARLVRDVDPQRAMALLETHAATHAVAANMLATMVRGSDPERAIALLEPHVDNAHAAVTLATLVGDVDPQRAIALLETHAVTNFYAAKTLRSLRRGSNSADGEVDIDPLDLPDAKTAVRLASDLRDVDPQRAIALLEPHAASNVYAANILASIVCDTDPERAVSLLEPHAATNAYAANNLAAIVSDTDPQGAISLLEPHAATNARSASALLRLRQKSDFVDGLTDIDRKASRDAKLAVKQASQIRYTDPQRAIALVEPHAATNVYAAVTLASIIRDTDPERAMALLEPFAAESGAAANVLAGILRRTDSQRAVALLEPHALSHAPAAITLASIICATDRQGAIAILEPHAAGSALAAKRLHELKHEASSA